MKIYKRYRCDKGHEWTVYVHRDDNEQPEDAQCPDGHIAVTCNEEEPADEVQVLLRSAARIVDSTKGQVWLSGRYFLVLLDNQAQELGVSRENYSWEDVVKLAALFKGKSKDLAMDWWARKSP